MASYRNKHFFALGLLLLAELSTAIWYELISNILEWISKKLQLGDGGKMTTPLAIILAVLIGFELRFFWNEFKSPIGELRKILNKKIKQACVWVNEAKTLEKFTVENQTEGEAINHVGSDLERLNKIRKIHISWHKKVFSILDRFLKENKFTGLEHLENGAFAGEENIGDFLFPYRVLHADLEKLQTILKELKPFDLKEHLDINGLEEYEDEP